MKPPLPYNALLMLRLIFFAAMLLMPPEAAAMLLRRYMLPISAASDTILCHGLALRAYCHYVTPPRVKRLRAAA